MAGGAVLRSCARCEGICQHGLTVNTMQEAEIIRSRRISIVTGRKYLIAEPSSTQLDHISMKWVKNDKNTANGTPGVEQRQEKTATYL